jgi:hypothetical protein
LEVNIKNNFTMERLEINNGPFIKIRKWLGIFLLFSGVALFFSSIGEDHRIILLITSCAFALNGIYHLTDGFGLEKTWLISGPDFLTIKWSNKLNPVTIHVGGIREISLTRFSIRISLKSRKPLKLDIGYLDRAQKKEIYQFLIDYANQKNLKLIRNF